MEFQDRSLAVFIADRRAKPFQQTDSNSNYFLYILTFSRPMVDKILRVVRNKRRRLVLLSDDNTQ